MIQIVETQVCDQCGKTVRAEYQQIFPLGEGTYEEIFRETKSWLRLHWEREEGSRDTWHFCSPQCAGSWLQGQTGQR